MPWLLWKSLRFRFADFSSRGIHLGFDGTVGRAYLTIAPLMLMFLAPTVATLTAQGLAGAPKPDEALRLLGRLYLGFAFAAPWFYFPLWACQHRNARGTTPFAFDGRVRSAYRVASSCCQARRGPRAACRRDARVRHHVAGNAFADRRDGRLAWRP